MLGTIERLGFEALARSKESAGAAFASAAALGAVAFAYHRSSSSEAETYERAASKREAREEMAEAVELRSDVRGNRDATEQFREQWERTYRKPFPYEIDAYGRIRPEGSREEFGFLPDIMPHDLEMILRTRREVPTAMELRAWGIHLARGGQNTLSRAEALNQAIESLRSKGVKDAWIPILWTEGPRGGPNPPKYRSPEHAEAYAEIVKNRKNDSYDALYSASNDIRWNIVKDSKTPLQDLQKIEQAINVSRFPNATKDLFYNEVGEERDRAKKSLAKVIRRLLDLGVGPEAVLVAAMAGQGIGRLDSKDIETLSLQVDKNVSKIRDPENRKRVAAATAMVFTMDTGKLVDRTVFNMLWPLNRHARDYKPLLPQFPRARNDVASRLVIGTPIEQVFPKIPKKFAIAHLSKLDERMGTFGESEVREAFVRTECEQAKENAESTDKHSGVAYSLQNLPLTIGDKPAVAEWVANVCKDKPRLQALTALRRVPVPGGAMVQRRYVQHIDEISDQDIRGPKDSVNDVFERAAARIAQEMKRDYMQRPGELLGQVPTWWPVDTIAELEKSGAKIRQLRTARELDREGREMKHCVGTYCPLVERGGAYIASMKLPNGERATLDFSPDGTLRQNYAYQNQKPSDEAIAFGKALEAEAKRRISER